MNVHQECVKKLLYGFNGQKEFIIKKLLSARGIDLADIHPFDGRLKMTSYHNSIEVWSIDGIEFVEFYKVEIEQEAENYSLKVKITQKYRKLNNGHCTCKEGFHLSRLNDKETNTVRTDFGHERRLSPLCKKCLKPWDHSQPMKVAKDKNGKPIKLK